MQHDHVAPSPLWQWFINTVETFAPPAVAAERQQWYSTLMALAPETRVLDDMGLFIVSQIVAAQQVLTASGSRGKTSGRRGAHETWYAKERQRVAKLLTQILESPVVVSLQATVQYYDAETITCQHGRNVKTCEALYALSVTLQLLERQPVHGVVRKQVERLRQREPHLPPQHELCPPESGRESAVYPARAETILATPSGRLAEEVTTYLLGTVVNRLRHGGLTIAQSCTFVDAALTWCFGWPDPQGTRPQLLAEQWRRLSA